MYTSDFAFDLPENLIAQYPSQVRGNDRLIVVCNSAAIIGRHILGIAGGIVVVVHRRHPSVTAVAANRCSLGRWAPFPVAVKTL
jgi:hypothetical protein